MPNELTKADPKAVDTVIVRAQQQLATAEGFERVLIVAQVMNDIRDAIDPFMPAIMRLQNTKLGFTTDKKEGYHADIVRDCVIKLVIEGGQITGNEMTIISGNCYLTKEHFIRRVSEFPGLTDYEQTLYVPVGVKDNPTAALVPARASWKLNGVPGELTCISNDKGDNRISVKVNSGMGPDAILGKAERKLRHKVMERLLGKPIPVADEPEVSPAKPIGIASSNFQQFLDEIEACQTADQCNQVKQRIANAINKDITSDEARSLQQAATARRTEVSQR